MARLPQKYYLGDTVSISKSLLGKYLVRTVDGHRLVCRITETEAYVGSCDKACHAYGYHKTRRNAVMFGPPGRAYLYLIYGMHCCLNLVTEPEGEPSAVLLRALEPISGRDELCRRRFGTAWEDLTTYQRNNFLNGPGKLCKALSLTTAENGMDLTAGEDLYVCETLAELGLPEPAPARFQICAGPRIGVNYAEEARDFPWRFWMEREA